MTIDEIEQAIEALGVRVVAGATPSGHWAGYSHKRKVIVVSPALTQYQRRAALLHELIHVERGDDGHQSEHVERSINREVAQRLIKAVDYVRAEELHSGSVAGIAVELEVPVWVIEGYQDHLRRRAYR